MTGQIVGSFGRFEIRPANGFGKFKISRAGSDEGRHMASATEEGTEIVAVGADIESLGAVDAEPDGGKGDFQDFILVDPNPPRGSVDDFAFAG